MDISNSVETIDHAAHQDDRWLFVVLLVIGLITVWFLARYFMRQIAELQREIVAVRSEFETHLRTANAEIEFMRYQLGLSSGAVLKSNEITFEYRKLGSAGYEARRVPICGEFSRELVALEVERRMDAKDVIRILDEAVLARGCVPEFIRGAVRCFGFTLKTQALRSRLEVRPSWP